MLFVFLLKPVPITFAFFNYAFFLVVFILCFDLLLSMFFFSGGNANFPPKIPFIQSSVSCSTSLQLPYTVSVVPVRFLSIA